MSRPRMTLCSLLNARQCHKTTVFQVNRFYFVFEICTPMKAMWQFNSILFNSRYKQTQTWKNNMADRSMLLMFASKKSVILARCCTFFRTFFVGFSLSLYGLRSVQCINVGRTPHSLARSKRSWFCDFKRCFS